MDYQNRRYLSLLGINRQIDICKPLEEEIETDYLVIGGGSAGLHAAQRLADKGCRVVLVEKNICGGGMSGRSGGFLTPDSELGLRQIESFYGEQLAKKIRQYGLEGQQRIVDNIRTHSLHCDLREQDSLLLGIGKKGEQAIRDEHTDRTAFGLDSDYIPKAELPRHITGCCYTGGVRYTDCYAINPMQYCQELKGHLLKQGVRIYEFTHIYKLEKHYATANLGGIRFKQAIVCPGKAEDEIFPGHARHTYGIQNFITISEPLSETQIKAMMPFGECMCRDTNLVFTYYRLTGDRRIVLGGGNPVSSFFPRDLLYDSTIASVIRGFKHMFPPLREVTFPQYRSGRIQASRDLMPLIGPSHRFSNQIRVQGAVGLPRAASSGTFAVDLLHNEADNELLHVFGYERTFFIPLLSSSRLLKTAIFGLNHAKVMGLI